MVRFVKNYVVIIISVIIITGCTSDKKSFILPEAENAKIDIKIERFDKELFSLNTDSLNEVLPEFYKEYKDFFDLFTHQIINIGGMEDQVFPDRLSLFLNDYLNRQVFKECQKKFPDLKKEEKELSRAFKYYKYYFPEKEIPVVYAYVSRFNQSIVTADGMLGIGIDKYLGRDCNYYVALGLPKYMIRKMYNKVIPVDCMRAWALSEFPFDNTKNDLVSNILYKAKIEYFVKSVLPYVPDTLLWGFSPDQLKWCKNNEAHIWTYLIDHKLFFSTEFMDIKRFTDDGPFTVPFTRESPARACVWMGFNIIQSYLENHPEVSLKQLMEDNDYHKILNKSMYEPE